MKKDKDKPKDKNKDAAQAEPARPLQIHDLSERVPTMTDKELDTLLANGRRLLAGGNAIQKKTAEVLVPLVEGELAKRAAAKDVALLVDLLVGLGGLVGQIQQSGGFPGSQPLAGEQMPAREDRGRCVSGH